MAAHAERIDLIGVLLEWILTLEQRRELRQIDTTSEVRSVGEYHRAPKFTIRFIGAVGARQVMEHWRIKRIPLSNAIQPDQQHVPAALSSDIGHSGNSQSITGAGN